MRISWLKRHERQSAPRIESLSSLVDEAFEVPSYRSSFPLVFGPEAIAELCVAEIDKKVVGCLAVLPISLVVNGSLSLLNAHEHSARLIHLACIGSVCVAQGQRGQGVAHALLKNVCQDLSAARFDGAGLFAHDGRVYRNAGFTYARADELVGCGDLARGLASLAHSGRKTVMSSLAPFRLEIHTSAELPETWIQRLWQLACFSWHSGNYTPVIGYRQFSVALSQTPMQVLTAWSSHENRIVGSLFYGKGADFPETWHGALSAADNRDDIVAALVTKAADLSPHSSLLIDEVSANVCRSAVAATQIQKSQGFMTQNIQLSPAGDGTLDFSALAIPSLFSI